MEQVCFPLASVVTQEDKLLLCQMTRVLCQRRKFCSVSKLRRVLPPHHVKNYNSGFFFATWSFLALGFDMEGPVGLNS